MLPHVLATRYVTPLREGGSLPGIAEADDLGTYVVKFRGAGQGVAALVAEIVCGELARRLGIRTPALAIVEMPAIIARYEPDEEVQDLLASSIGENLGVDYLPGSLGYDGVSHRADPADAARILWLDAFVGNVDRSWRNPNLLVWHGDLWAIDHGATLTFHHSWGTRGTPESFARQPYDTSDHVLHQFVPLVPDFSDELARTVTADLLDDVTRLVPDDWLTLSDRWPTAQAVRTAYRTYLLARLGSQPAWRPGRTAAA
jgi:hypothetical protein